MVQVVHIGGWGEVIWTKSKRTIFRETIPNPLSLILLTSLIGPYVRWQPPFSTAFLCLMHFLTQLKNENDWTELLLGPSVRDLQLKRCDGWLVHEEISSGMLL